METISLYTPLSKKATENSGEILAAEPVFLIFVKIIKTDFGIVAKKQGACYNGRTRKFLDRKD